MNLENVIYKLRRILDNRINALPISITSGGVDNMETYKYIIGQINAYEATKQELSNLLNDKEQHLRHTLNNQYLNLKELSLKDLKIILINGTNLFRNKRKKLKKLKP